MPRYFTFLSSPVHFYLYIGWCCWCMLVRIINYWLRLQINRKKVEDYISYICRKVSNMRFSIRVVNLLWTFWVSLWRWLFSFLWGSQFVVPSLVCARMCMLRWLDQAEMCKISHKIISKVSFKALQYFDAIRQ